MSLPEFIPGQRWISNTEPELGLGIIVKYESRRVTISFPAAAEERVYSANNAPLSRVRYHVGDKVFDHDDLPYRVTGVEELKGFIIYICEDLLGETVNLPELELNSAVHFSSPKDRLLAGQVDKHSRYKLRYQTLKNWGGWQQSQARGLLGPRVQLLPHQLYIANEVGQRHAPRVLLADEVGLGKTIEAGLVIHQQLLTGRANRVLIVVPESLVHQWLVEMLRRFNLSFTILDEDRCEALEESNDGQNPFESAQCIICSLDLLEYSETRFAQAEEAAWDMLVVDEAHHLEWTPEASSPAYDRIEAIARKSAGLLLLTATPEQLGVESHFARLRLLDPDRYPDLEKFQEEEEGYAPINHLIQQLMSESGASTLQQSAELQEQLRETIGEEALSALLQELKDAEGEDTREIIFKAVKSLLDRHGTGRVLFRNTRHAVRGFPDRQLTSWPLEAPEAYASFTSDDVMTFLQPERALGADWIAQDSRIPWLLDWLKSRRTEKTLIICAQAETAMDLEVHLNLRGGVRSAVFHEGLSLLERDRAGAYFADQIEGAQVLVCSEIGSEGRNFQFAKNLVFFDLPLNPDLLEQRIGRLDRIGQQHDVEIHVPYYENSAQEVLLRWYHEGMHAFERPFAAGQKVYQQFADELHDCLMTHKQDELNALLGKTREFSDAMVKALQEGRDPLLELNSCHPDTANKVIEAIEGHEFDYDLESYLEKIFDIYGVEHEAQSDDAIILRPGDHMHSAHFPALPEDGMTATFERQTALARDDIHYLTWEHPMTTGVMEMILESEFGNTSVCTLKLPPIQPGTLLLEAIYRLRCPAPKALQVERFVGQVVERAVVDSLGNDLGHVLQVEHLDQLGEKVPRRNAQDLVRHTRDQLEVMLDKAQEKVLPRQDALIEGAIKEMQSRANAEIARMEALAKVNPNIRQEEVEHIRAQAEKLETALRKSQLQLEAVRVAVAT
ncbi:RNA polymerase-binding ATPase [Hahella sp. CCB-MM4]|uniref:RNA polymerase-associated protein RapA n=1 Tax=Hahella sp. (strain CCB-MM4) TaxID=1926491 RepID=UPI000B9BC50A|nr:RNA polymerase-associated protein RapA [Hahella sp. CCB-MM4]OZG71067.1 RNA polymerase-binding ATPase [Hahella sp. CCB-MM4]